MLQFCETGPNAAGAETMTRSNPRTANGRSRLRRGASRTFIDQSGEKAGIDDELAPFRVERGRRLGGNRLVPRLSLLLEFANIVPDGDQHVAEFLEFGLVADGLAVAGNDDGVALRCGEIGVGR